MNILNLSFIAEAVAFLLIVTGLIPRQMAFLVAVLFFIFILVRPVREGTRLTVRSIPLFLALPITETFDGFNTWRIIVITLFVKWWFTEIFRKSGFKFRQYFNRPLYLESKLLLIILFLAIVSVAVAPDLVVALKRVIYFINLSLLGIVVRSLIQNRSFANQLITDIAIPTVIVVIVGYFQISLTFFIDIYQFMKLWGEIFQCNQFGSQWCTIAVWTGNTWFAYFGDQLSLRVFSLFPDSHSFPQFVILGLASIFAISLYKLAGNTDLAGRFSSLVKARAKLSVVWVPASFLIIILSGTRGIWAAGVGVVFLSVLIAWYLKKSNISLYKRNIFSYISLYLVLFFLLFSVAYPVFVSPQFLLSKGDLGLLANRIRSIIDFGETSNSQRLEIWKRSVESIQKHPALGVGIGNFPVVLNQAVYLSRAGSSAHNIYLHVGAEMGIAALVGLVWLLMTLFYRTYYKFITSTDTVLALFYGWLLIGLPWVFAYSMTDVAIFDERAFLLLVVVFGFIWGSEKNINHENE